MASTTAKYDEVEVGLNSEASRNASDASDSSNAGSASDASDAGSASDASNASDAGNANPWDVMVQMQQSFGTEMVNRIIDREAAKSGLIKRLTQLTQKQALAMDKGQRIAITETMFETLESEQGQLLLANAPQFRTVIHDKLHQLSLDPRFAEQGRKFHKSLGFDSHPCCGHQLAVGSGGDEQKLASEPQVAVTAVVIEPKAAATADLEADAEVVDLPAGPAAATVVSSTS